MKRLLAGIFGAVLLMSMLAAPAMGGAGPTYNVQVGALLDESIFADGNNFYPDQISIHPADQLRFTSGGFHNAALLPVNEDPGAWLAANAAPGGEYSFIQSDPDDGPNGYKYNVQKVLFPSDFSCGTDTPCDYDGTGVVNSGIALGDALDFTARLDVPAGSTVWALCLIHPGTMRMQIDVVADAAPVQTQAEIDAARDTAIADDTAAAQALHEQLIDQHSSHMEGDRKVWDMYAGYDTERVALLGFYPAKQKVRKGQGVEWHFGNLLSEDHTVSINKKQARAKIVAKDFLLFCDPDDDAGPGPDGPLELKGPPFCNDPTQLEADAAPLLISGTGNGKYTGGNDLESSPGQGANTPGDEVFQVNFNKNLDKNIKYICAIHPFMLGKVDMRK